MDFDKNNMQRQVLNVILGHSNFFSKDISQDNGAFMIMLTFLSTIFLIIFIAIFFFWEINICSIFLSIFPLIFFLLFAFASKDAFHEFKKEKDLKKIYNHYPNILFFIFQNISHFEEIDKNKLINYDWENNHHYLNYLIHKEDLEGFKKALPILIEKSKKHLTFNGKSYILDEELNTVEIESIIKTIDDLKSKHQNLKYPEYSLNDLTEKDLKIYYNNLLKLVYDNINT